MDTSTHYLPIDGNGTFIPDDDDFVVISVPEGIDSIDFIPADLDPGTTYVVDVWNGDCGYQTVEVVAVEMKVEPLAEWPKGIRSDLGVGEILDCSVKPPNLSISWSCTSGRAQFASPNASSTTLSVLDVPGGLTVTASIEGVALSTNYLVHAPEGIVYSRPYLPDVIQPGAAGAGCHVDVTIAPTNVAFDNLWIEEGYSVAFQTNGYFAIEGHAPAHDESYGACEKLQLEHSGNDGYIMKDSMGTDTLYPWSAGLMEWHIPIKWWISNGLSITNFHEFCDGEYTEAFDIAADGTTTVSKFRSEARRTIDGQTILKDSNGVAVQ